MARCLELGCHGGGHGVLHWCGADQRLSHALPHGAWCADLCAALVRRLLLGYGWLGNPLFLAGLTGVALLELRYHAVGMPAPLAWAGLVVVVLSWGRGIGSATGLYFLEPLIFANVPAFLWLAYYGLRVARGVRVD